MLLGGDITPHWLVAAYTCGAFPWTGEPPVPWYNPDPRLILLPEEFKLSRSMRKLVKNLAYAIRFDHDFEAVMRGCSTTPRPGQKGSWITRNMIRVYCELFKHGMTHSVGVYRGDRLLGGLYGLSFGRAFFGESMFSLEPNTSKLALWALCEFLKGQGFHFIDCQQVTAHLISLGAKPVDRVHYMAMLEQAACHESLHEPWQFGSMEPKV